MIKKQAGFTLVELMVTMVIFVLVIAAASSMFTGVLNQFKQQSRIAETNIEGNVGLQMLRTDIEQAGYGLPWELDGVAYDEAEDDTTTTTHDETDYNDSTANPPRAFVMDDDAGFNASDILVVKATNVAINNASHKWAYISNIGTNFDGTANNIMRSWTNSAGAAITDENLQTSDRVIALRPAVGSVQQVLVNNGGTFSTQFKSSLADFADEFEPVANSFETYIIYGVTSSVSPVTTPLRMPFNRADYYIRRPSNMPSRCAPGTGVLYKARVNHADGLLAPELPLLDCVADMQVALNLDINEDGTPGTVTSPGGGLLTSTEGGTETTVQQTLADASLLRTRLKDVRVYILAHEGQKDAFYTYPNATINLTDQDLGVLKAFDLNTDVGTTYVNYRWKIYTLVIKPFNLR